VLLIHGSPGSLEDWAAMTGELAKTHRVTAYDRSGQGYSEPSGTSATYQHHAEVARALIDALKLHDVVVVGHSYGGATALALAVQHPTAVRGYVVVDSTVYPRAAKVDALYEILALPVVGVGVARLVGSFVGRRKLRAGIDHNFRGQRPAEGFYALREEIWLQPKVNHALADERVHADASLRELSAHYGEIAAPLVIVGQAEDPERRLMLERLHGNVHGSQLTLVPGTGHYIQFQRPDAIAAAIDAVSSGAKR